MLDADTAAERGNGGECVILVRWETTPDDIHGLIAGAGRPHRARRHDVARRGRRARDGQAVRRRLRGALDRRRARGRLASAATTLREGDVITIDGGTGEVIIGAVRSSRRRSTRTSRRCSAGPTTSAGSGAGERRHARGRRAGARVRRGGHRPLPDGAHVHGRGAAADRARDDPRRRRGGRRAALERLLPMQQSDFEGIFEAMAGLPVDDPAARPAAARVPAAGRGGDRRAHAPPHPRAARGEPDARHARLPARPHVAGGLRDAGAGDHPRRGRRARAHRRGAARRDHAPARRLRRRSCAGCAS